MPPSFAHPSEKEYADLFTRHGLEWEYEPFTFPLSWTSTGKLLSAFSPDFYFPKLGLFLEVTVMREPLATRKRGKIRRTLMMYPMMKIRLFTLRDYRRIIEGGDFDPARDLIPE